MMAKTIDERDQEVIARFYRKEIDEDEAVRLIIENHGGLFSPEGAKDYLDRGTTLSPNDDPHSPYYLPKP